MRDDVPKRAEQFARINQNLQAMAKKNKTKVERGAASIRVSLSRGTITVRHGSDGEVLITKKNVKAGEWSRLFTLLHSIETV